MSEETWTTRRLLGWMAEAFSRKGLESPRLMAELLVSHVIGATRMELYTQADRPASELERSRLRELVGRALRHEPIQYLVGEAWFYSLAMHVDRRVLIPRACTGVIVDAVLRHARAEPGFGGRSGEGVLIGDVCTGSGCVAIALLKNLPGARAVATDVSAEALEVAARNAARHGVADRLDLVRGDLLEALREHPASRADGSLHFLVSNPPYIPDSEWGAVEANVKEHEPELALRGGADGMRFVRPLLEEGWRLVRPGGLVAVEVASVNAGLSAAVLGRAEGIGSVEVLRDLDGLERVVVGRRRVGADAR